MPEGHTVHRLARDLRRDLASQSVRAESRQDRFVAGAARLDGGVVGAIEAYGKHLFLHFESGDLLHVHLGLVGKFRRHEPAIEPTEAVRLRLATDAAAWDLTGPMTCAVTDPGRRETVTAGLGPDPLRRDGRAAQFVDAVVSSRRAISLLLLDQSVIAGIGNVFRSEALFLLGVHPSTRGADLGPDLAAQAWRLLGELLRDGVRRNRIVTRRRDEIPRGRIDPSEALYVYKRADMPCRWCGTDVERAEVGGRKVWWCPSCQPPNAPN